MPTTQNTYTLETMNGNSRMSTRELLIRLRNAVEEGAHSIHIEASGQHDIGGPLWAKDGELLSITVKNPGQRVGAMCLPNTAVVVEGSAPADVGWLNSGGTITVLGDAGDTAGHCAAGGILYIGGRAGTRSGSLMKHDPQYPAPELWILQNVGAFSFEFMGGGRPFCVLMRWHNACVGVHLWVVVGEVYVRGALPPLQIL